MGEQVGRAPWWVPTMLAGLCLLVRLPGLTLPVLEDGHPYRQADTAMIARNYYRHGFHFFWPQTDLVATSVDAGIHRETYTNPEFPLYPYVVGLGFLLTGPNDWLPRLLSALCAVGTTLLVYAATRRVYGDWSATVAAAFFAFNPLSIFFTRAILPEPLLVLLTAGLIAALLRWIDTGSRAAFGVAFGCLVLAPLVKSPALHLMPAAAIACGIRYGRSMWRRPEILALAIAPIALTKAWYAWSGWLGEHYISHFLLKGGREVFNPDLWLHNHANFYPRFAAVMVLLVGCLLGGPVALRGLWRRVEHPGRRVLVAWLVCAALVITAAAGAAISHYYYDLLLVLPLAVFVGAGCGGEFANPLRRWIVTVAVLLGLLLMGTMSPLPSWYSVRPGEAAAARAMQRVIPREAMVCTLTYGVQLLYAADRRGSFLLADKQFLRPEAMDQAVQSGFEYFATGRLDLLDSPDGARLKAWLGQRRLVEAGPGYVIYDLRPGAAR